MTKPSLEDDPPLGPSASQDWPIKERLEAIAAFAPVFSACDFSPGQWANAKNLPEGVLSMGWFDLGEQASRFEQVCYKYGWVYDFDWMSWTEAGEYRAFCDNPDSIKSASALQLARLLTTAIRMDRFCEGALAEAFKKGVIAGVVERAKVLRTALRA